MYAEDFLKDRVELREMSDIDLLEELYIMYSDLLHAVARKVLLCKEQDRECVSEVFILAIKKVHILRNHPNKGGWLVLAARNQARYLNRVYTNIHLKEISICENTGYEYGVYWDYECFDHYGKKSCIDLDKTIAMIIREKLCEQERILYNLFYTKGMRLSEIGEIIGISKSAIKMRKMRLDRKLRKYVEELSSSDSFWEENAI